MSAPLRRAAEPRHSLRRGPPADLHAVMFLYATGRFDPRVSRTGASLAAAGYRVILIGLLSPDQADWEETEWGQIIRVGGHDTRRELDELKPRRRGSRLLFRIRQARWLGHYAQAYVSWRARATAASL